MEYIVAAWIVLAGTGAVWMASRRLHRPISRVGLGVTFLILLTVTWLTAL